MTTLFWSFLLFAKSHPDTIVALVLLGAVLAWIARTALLVYREGVTAPGTSLADWDYLSSKIRVIRQKDIEVQDVGPVTKHALRLVLSEEGGYGNIALLPQALDVLRRPFEEAARSLRVLGGGAVLVGLVYSVALFVVIFVGLAEKKFTGTGLEHLWESLAQPLFDHLRFLYLGNAIALFLGLVLQVSAGRVARYGKAVEKEATEVLLQLESSPSEGLDPRIARAIQKLVEEFRDSLGSMQEDILERLGDVSDRMTVIGEQLVRLAEEQGSIVRPLDGIDAVLRALCESQENLATGMKDGLRALAEPLGLWKPAMDELRRAAENLEAAANRLRPETIEEGQQELVAGFREVAQAVRELRDIVSKSSAANLAPVLSGLQTKLQDVQSVLVRLADRPAVKPEELQRLLGEIGSALATIQLDLATVKKAPQETREELRKLLSALEELRKRGIAPRSSSSSELGSLVRVLGELEQTLRGSRRRGGLGGIQ